MDLELEPLDPATRGVKLFESRAWGNRPGFESELGRGLANLRQALS